MQQDDLTDMYLRRPGRSLALFLPFQLYCWYTQVQFPCLINILYMLFILPAVQNARLDLRPSLAHRVPCRYYLSLASHTVCKCAHFYTLLLLI